MSPLEKKTIEHVLSKLKSVEVTPLYFAAETASVKSGNNKPDTGFISKAVHIAKRFHHT